MAPTKTKSSAAKKNGAGAAPEALDDIRGLSIPRPKIQSAVLSLKGISPLIMHKWSAKAIAMLEGSQTGKAKAQKEARRPVEEAYEGAYIVPGMEDKDDGEFGKFYFPAPAFKHAFLYGVAQTSDVRQFPKTKAAGWVFVDADPIIAAEQIRMRTDTGRIGQGTATMIYRLQFDDWTADLPVSYNANAISLEQVVALFDLGGTGGVGEWRPTSPKNKSGDFGRFVVTGAHGGGK